MDLNVFILFAATLIEQQNKLQTESIISPTALALDQRSSQSSNGRHLAPSDFIIFPLTNTNTILSLSNTTCSSPCSHSTNCQSCIQAQVFFVLNWEKNL